MSMRIGTISDIDLAKSKIKRTAKNQLLEKTTYGKERRLGGMYCLYNEK